MSDEIAALTEEIAPLHARLDELERDAQTNYYISSAAQESWASAASIPRYGQSAATVESIVENTRSLDFNHRLNTSSYVDLSFEEGEGSVVLSDLAQPFYARCTDLVGFDGYPVHEPLRWPVVGQGVVHGRSVVPECYRSGGPFEAALVLR